MKIIQIKSVKIYEIKTKQFLTNQILFPKKNLNGRLFLVLGSTQSSLFISSKLIYKNVEMLKVALKPKGGGDPPLPRLIFFHFHASYPPKNCQIIGFHPSSSVVSPGKSWIRRGEVLRSARDSI